MYEQEQEDEEEFTIITDTIGDKTLQFLEQDYIPLPRSSSEDSSSSENSSSSEESDYSL